MRSFAGFTLFIMLCLLGMRTSAQNRSDSLLKAVDLAQNDLERLKWTNRLAVQYSRDGKYDMSIMANQEALNLSKKIGDTTIRLVILQNLGSEFTSHSAYSPALQSYFEALKLAEAKGNKAVAADLNTDIGMSFWRQNENGKALDYLNKAIAMAEKIKNNRKLASMYNNIGIIYRGMGDFPKSIDYYSKSIELSKEFNDKRVLMNTYNNLAFIYQLSKDKMQAFKYYISSLTMAQETNDRLQMEIVMGNIGSLYLEAKEYKNSEEYLLKALAIAIELTDYEGLKEINDNLTSLYTAQGKTDQAFYHYKEFIKARDFLQDEQTEKEMQREEMKYEFEKEKLATQKEQEKRDAIALSEKKRQQHVIWSVSACLIVVIFLSIFLYNRFKVTREQKTIIEEQKHLVEEKNKEILDSIHYAQRIQKTLLANEAVLKEHLRSHFIFFKPKDIVSGDFYWATSHNERFYLAICDSTGHGVPGAFMSLLSIGFLSEAINEKNIIEPGAVLDYVRERLINSISKEDQQDGFDGILACFDQQKKTITYSAANNSPVLIQNNLLLHLPCDKMPVGKGERNQNFATHTIQAKTGDTLYFYTDGYADQFGGPNGKKLKYKLLNETLQANCTSDTKEQKEKLVSLFNEWKGKLEQVDDVCIVGIKI